MSWFNGLFQRDAGASRCANESATPPGTIKSATMDADFNDLTAGINACLNKDGENAMTADLDLGGNNPVNPGGAWVGTYHHGANCIAPWNGGQKQAFAIPEFIASSVSNAPTIGFCLYTVLGNIIYFYLNMNIPNGFIASGSPYLKLPRYTGGTNGQAIPWQFSGQCQLVRQGLQCKIGSVTDWAIPNLRDNGEIHFSHKPGQTDTVTSVAKYGTENLEIVGQGFLIDGFARFEQ